jgi:hypothetical protein
MPFRSSGLRIGMREFVSSRDPFSPQASGTTPRSDTARFTSCPTSLARRRPRLSWSGTKKGIENRLSWGTWADQLMVDPTARSMMPWRSAVNSRDWSPPTRETPG